MSNQSRLWPRTNPIRYSFRNDKKQSRRSQKDLLITQTRNTIGFKSRNKNDDPKHRIIQPQNYYHDSLPIISRIATVAQLMRIPVSFANVKTQALVDTGAAASFLAHRLLDKIPFKEITSVEQNQANLQYFKTVSGEIVKPTGRFELQIKLAKDHPFKHTFYVVSDLDEGCILGYDFLENNGLSINPSERSMTYLRENQTKKIIVAPASICSFTLVAPKQFSLVNVEVSKRPLMKNLLNAFEKLFAESINQRIRKS